MCEKTIQDVVERFWDIIEEININRVLRFLRDNIVSKYCIGSITKLSFLENSSYFSDSCTSHVYNMATSKLPHIVL